MTNHDKTLLTILSLHAKANPDKTAFTVFNDLTGQQDVIGYAELEQTARTLARRLRQDTALGSRVVLCYPTSVDYIQAFYACLYAGLIAVPLFPLQSRNRTDRVTKVVLDAQATLVLTRSEHTALLNDCINAIGLDDTRILATDTLPLEVALPLEPSPDITPNTLAFLQYTSGSTGDPKGVMVTHSNILANVRALEEATGCHAQDVFVNWLPLFHDMGLVNTLMLPVYLGVHSVIMSPKRFIQNPQCWLEALSYYKGTIGGAPNFAYDLCLKKIHPEAIEGLDLSSWRIAFNAAEAVNPKTLTHFSTAFLGAGFKETAFYPCYGMAEATVFVTGGSASNKPVIAHKTVSCGTPSSEHDIAIVNSKSLKPVQTGEVGEVWVTGPSIAQGYWGMPEKSVEVFAAQLQDCAKPWLRTGDLGFVQDGELFITGRLKELIILNGINYYPTDIEQIVVACDKALNAGASAAFSIDVDGQERLVVVQEVERTALRRLNPPPIYAAIAEALVREFELSIYDIVLMKPGRLPKTTSGKVQRQACKQQYQQQALVAVASFRQQGDLVDKKPPIKKAPLEQQLADIFCDVLTLPDIAVDQNYLRLGADSITLTQAAVRIEESMNIELPVSLLFDYPTIETLHTYLVEQQSRLNASHKSSLKGLIPPSQRNAPQPLSFSQTRLWFIWKLEGANALYNECRMLRLTGKISVPTLTQSLQTIVSRHEVFRTRFIEQEGKPYQMLGEAFELNVSPQKIDSPKQLEKRLNEEAHYPFDLSRDRLIRAVLLENSPNDYVLCINIHHIMTDGLSMGVMLKELTHLYQAEPLSPLRVQYLDFAAWQRQWLQGPVLNSCLNYWRGQLEGLPLVHDLPCNLRPAQQSFEGGSYCTTLDEDFVYRLKAFCLKHHVTLFMWMQTVFATLISRYSHESDIVMGSPVAGREHREVENLIGFFVNTLVLRSEISGKLNFVQQLEKNRKIILEGFAHQHMPFDTLVEELNPSRSLSYSPLFQVFFSMRDGENDTISLPNITTSIVPLASDLVKYDLELNCVNKPKGMQLEWRYSRALFDKADIVRMAHHFFSLAQQVLAHPEVNLGELSFLSEQQVQQQLTQWNATQAAYPQEQCVHHLFEEHVRKTPTATALVFQEQSLSYDALNQSANRLAHYLLAEPNLDIAPDSLVGVFLERSLNVVVAMLAIIKAGAAYVPLDPHYPKDRLAYMLNDARPVVLITQQSLLEQLPEDTGPILCLDAPPLQTPLKKASAENPRVPALNARHLMYIIYTSGSTGHPKGVCIEHRSFHNQLFSMAKRPGLKAGESILSISPLSFDISGLEIFLPLVVGGCTHLASSDLSLDPVNMLTYLRDKHIDVLEATPPTWRMLMSVPDHIAFKKGFRAWCGGEPLQPDLAQRLNEHCTEVWNMYGPTETTVWSSCKRIVNSINVGKPIDNVKFYVLDNHLNPVPVGVAGTLYISGHGVARQYWNNPELTAEKYIANPYATNADDQKIYDSGDLLRWCDNGELEYVGRTDHQVKVRGFRIELGEIENVMLEHVLVKQAVILAEGLVEGGSTEEKQLIAYVVLSGKQVSEGAATGELFDHLHHHAARALPQYMVPSAFVVLHAMPITPNGKINRKALPKIDQVMSRREYVAPKTDLEKQLCCIWADLLNIERVGVTDDFFRLGGNSLLAVQANIKIQARTQLNLSLKQLFLTPTVGGIASYLSEKTTTLETPLPQAIEDTLNAFEPFPLSGVQQAYMLGRSALFELGNISTHSYVELDFVDLAPARFSAAWNHLIQRHGMLRCVFPDLNHQQILASVPQYDVAYSDLRQASQTDKDAQLKQIRDVLSHQMFEVDTWPLFELRLTQINEHTCRLHVSIDILITDASSLMILLEELRQVYQTPEQPLKPLTLSFRDYMLAKKRIRGLPLYQQARDYWLARIPTLPMAPELPLAKAPSEVKTPHFKRREVRISKGPWHTLRTLANDNGITPTVLLLSLFSQVLGRWCHNPVFTLNLTLFNRLPLHDQVNDIAGDFTSLTLLEVHNAYEQSLLSNARQVQARLWEDIEHRTFGGTEVLRELNRTMPVVFTSALGVVKEGVAQEHEAAFGEEQFAITQTPQVWLDHQVREHHGELILSWDGVEELFPSGLLDDAFTMYINTLNQLIDRHLKLCETFPVALPPAQAERRAAEAQTQVDIPECLLQSAFQAQVALNGDALAVVSQDKRLDYRTLDALACEYGTRLRQKGAQANTLVAVVMEKGWEQVVGVLSVLYSGAAYLPIDAHSPQDWIAQLLVQGEVAHIITQPQFIPLLGNITHATLMAVQAECEFNTAPPAPVQSPTDLAYVIFTSGSTGQPKGVMIDHQGALNTVLDINQKFNVTQSDKVLALSSLSFDLSVYDIFGTLAAGGTIVMPDAHQEKDPAHWLGLVRAENVTIWNSVPALTQLYVDELRHHPQAPTTPSLRLVLMSGDWIPVELPDQIKPISQRVEVVSLGGATEASIWSIYYPIKTPSSEWKSVPYGKPLGNQRFYVLDSHLQLCPEYVQGDLYIGGRGLAKGYWRDTNKTEASFFKHPHTGEALYRTGDTGRYLADGNIEFMGRIDNQVKVNGHRIELEQIESVLSQCHFIDDAVVVAVGETQASKRLIGYVVLHELHNSKEIVDADFHSEEDAAIARINEAAEKAAFKMQQRGLRQDLSECPRQELPYKPDVNTDLSWSGQGEPGHFLTCLAQMAYPDHPIAKRFYPSAGSLYPIQTYLSMTNGCYYYDPAHHALVKTHDEPISNTPDITIFFIADKSAIVPLYGELSYRFCALEVGHMSELLVGCARAMGMALAQENRPLNRTQCQQRFKLNPDHHRVMRYFNAQVVQALPDIPPLNPLARQSYRQYLEEPALPQELEPLLAHVSQPQEDILLYCHVKSQGRDNVFYYSFTQGQLRDRHHCASLGAGNDFKAYFNGASFAIYFVGDPANQQALFSVGAMAQTLMHQAPGLGLGLCPLGTPSLDIVDNAITLEGTEQVLYCLEGGKISEAQTRQWPVQSVPGAFDVSTELHHYLQEKLPAYMVPAQFLTLPALPLTANGKVDRKTLQANDIAGPEPTPYVAPKTQIEKDLADIWCELLHLDKVGTQDNFFHVGGDSLIATRMVSMIRQKYQIDIALLSIFEHTQIQDLASLVSLSVNQACPPKANDIEITL